MISDPAPFLQKTLKPIKVTAFPNDFQQFIVTEIKEFNYFLKQMHLTKDKNQNFLVAVEKAVNFLLHRTKGAKYADIGDTIYFEEPTFIYTSGYLIGCLTEHAPLFFAMDKLYFPYLQWTLVDINKKDVHAILRASSSDQLGSLVVELHKIKKEARDNNWQGNLKIMPSFDMKNV